MAVTTVIAAKTAAVALTDATTEFVASGPFTFYGDDFAVGEFAMLYRIGPSAALKPATTKLGVAMVSAYPNTIIVDHGGTFRVVKTLTAAQASVGYELL